jgi:hypothetical protein
MAKAKPKKMHSASYTLNEAALKIKPKILEYQERDRQRTLPGIHLPTRHGDPIRDEKPSAPPGRIMRPGYQPAQTSSASGVPLPLVALCDQGNSPDLHPGVTMRPGLVAPCDQDINSSGTPWSHHATTLVAPCDQPGSTMRPDPASGLDLVSTKDSSVSKQNSKTTTSSDVPVELKNGLREILPSLDDRAIKQLWLKCQDNAPDCTVEEVLHFAWEKTPALGRNSTHNPAGLLIHAVPLCFEGDERSALAHYREELAREETRSAAMQKRAAEQEAEWARRAPDVQRELEEARRLQEQREAAKEQQRIQRAQREQRQREARQAAILKLDQMPAAEKEALRARALQDPQISALFESLRKLGKQGMASESAGETQLRDKVIEILAQDLMELPDEKPPP